MSTDSPNASETITELARLAIVVVGEDGTRCQCQGEACEWCDLRKAAHRAQRAAADSLDRRGHATDPDVEDAWEVVPDDAHPVARGMLAALMAYRAAPEPADHIVTELDGFRCVRYPDGSYRVTDRDGETVGRYKPQPDLLAAHLTYAIARATAAEAKAGDCTAPAPCTGGEIAPCNPGGATAAAPEPADARADVAKFALDEAVRYFRWFGQQVRDPYYAAACRAGAAAVRELADLRRERDAAMAELDRRADARPDNLFAQVFDGKRYTATSGRGKYTLLGPACIREAMAATDVPLVRDVLASLVWQCALSDDRARYMAADAMKYHAALAAGGGRGEGENDG